MTTQQANQIDVYNNFATPLPGTYLNLPAESCILQCPSCGLKDMTKVEMELHRTSWAEIICSRISNWCCCCCRCKENNSLPFFKEEANHYCTNCGCYFGQRNRFGKLVLPRK